MASYHSSFTYLGTNSAEQGLMIATFNPDNGEVDSFVSMDSIYTDNYDGTKRINYGARYNSVAVISIPLIKSNGGDFSVTDVRKILRWLSGARTDSWLDLYVNDAIEYSFLGKVTNVKQYKFDARVIGLIVEFTSASPWAYSPKLIYSFNAFPEGTEFAITNLTDDLYTYIYPKIVYTNLYSDGSLSLCNKSINNEVTIINNLVANEVITLDSNQFIFSDNAYRIFGNDFNFVFPRLAPGDNVFVATGSGTVQLSYRYPIKIGDCTSLVSVIGDCVCENNSDDNAHACQLDLDADGVLYMYCSNNCTDGEQYIVVV